jgi:hypothetical protein
MQGEKKDNNPAQKTMERISRPIVSIYPSFHNKNIIV